MAAKTRIENAIHQSVLDAKEPVIAGPDGKPRTVNVAIGDAQAPLGTFLGILELHGLLGDDGRLKPEVSLVSIGDHFDYGPTAWRRWATEEGMQLLAWLSAHPSDQVTLIFGNHDYARVGELASFDQGTYLRAREDADRAYNGGERNTAHQQAFLARWPQFPDSEMIARDFSSFHVRQRGLVTTLLRAKRFRLAHAKDRLLFVHAGVTRGDLEAIGAPMTGAAEIAAALNRFLDEAVARWSGGPLNLMPLHRPGSGEHGEPRGILAHRPAHPDRGLPEQFEGPPRRRFDPRDVPPAVTQVIGHIRDGKCRELLGAWAEADAAGDGPITQLHVTKDGARYSKGCSSDAAMLFIDGGMNYAPIDRYELLDLDSVQPRVKLAISGT